MTRGKLTPVLLQWFGVFGAPFAWATQHVVGFALTLAACDRVRSAVPVDTVTTIVSVVCALIAVAAGAASVLSFLETRDASEYDAPPAGRRHFLALIGLTITPLFLAMIVMSASGVLDLPECRQS